MGDEKKLKEEFKEEACKVIDELSLDDLETIAGGSGGYSCNFCGETFSGKFGSIYLLNHMASKHPDAVAALVNQNV